MNELTFIAALRMHSFKLFNENKVRIAVLGNGGPLNSNRSFYVRVYFYKQRKSHTPFIEITGSKISFTVYMNYKDAYKFITNQELK